MSIMIGKLIRNKAKSSLATTTPALNSIRNNYFFLLPEVPSDTAETNALMRNDEIPEYNEITSKKIHTGFQKLAVSYDAQFSNLINEFEQDPKGERNFESTFSPIEKALVPMDFAYKTARHLSFIYPYSNYHIGFSKIEHKMGRTKNEKWLDKTYYKVLKEIESNKHLLNSGQTRLLERSLRNCVFNGINLNEANFKMCKELNNKIQEQQSIFKHRLNYANKKFGLRISDQMNMEDVPRNIKMMIANDRSNPDKGPWTIFPNDIVFEGIMKYSGNRNLRKTLFEGYYSRASYVNEQFQTNNSEIIKDLIRYRKNQAALFGYKNFAEFQIDNKAAHNVNNVIDLFEKVRKNLKPVVDEDLARLQKFSSTHGNLTPFENYDVEYWKQRHTNQNYNTDPTQISQYFPFKKVMSGLIELTKNLFNVDLRIDESSETKSRLWNPDVDVFKCFDENNNHISTLIVDPYLRPNKIDSIWSYSGRDSSLTTGTKPLVYLNMNVRNLGQSSTISFDQLKKLFSEYGKAIQILLTQTDYTELSDLNSIEMDAANLNNNLFERFVYVPEIISLVSGHVNTGEKLPIDVLKRLESADSNFKTFKLMKQTFLSAFDIESHISDKFWTDVMEELWSRYMPIKLAKNDFRPCQFTTIFGENFGCSYYSLMWSEMLSADIFDAFRDVGFQNKSILKDVGRKYRDTFLKNGSSVHPNELFRQFRGRNPSMDPFIKSYLPAKQ